MADVANILTLDALSVGYTDVPIVVDFSLQVRTGSITTFIGGNGAGKSTLLRAIYGLNKYFSGRIVYAGEEIQQLSPPSRLAKGIGFVPQGRCNFPKLSVRENLELGAFTLNKMCVRAAIEKSLELFPMLRAKLSTLAGNLSGGQQQILETAMVLQTSPRLLLLDEPSLGLSPIMLYEVFEAVNNIRHSGVTVIIVEQNVRGALRISDHAVVMELGRKFLEGSASDISGDPRIRAAYLGGDSSEIANPQQSRRLRLE